MDNAEWNYDPDEHEYQKHIGQCAVAIYRDVGEQWVVKIVSGRRYVYRLGFLSLSEAQGWSEQEAARSNSADRRLKEREAGA
jgi:hypothetical protein